MKFRIFCVLFFAFLAPIFAQQTTIGKYQKHEYNGKNLKIFGTHGIIEITPYTKQVFRVAYFGKEVKYDTPYTLVASPDSVKTTLKEDEKSIWLSSTSLALKIDKENLLLSFYLNGKTSLLKNHSYATQSDGKKYLLG